MIVCFITLCSWFSSLLSSCLMWPVVSATSHDLTCWTLHYKHFSQLFGHLMKLDDKWIMTNSTDVSRDLPLPLELMVLPLRKRFKYHFMEERKTNNLEKVHTLYIIVLVSLLQFL